jgi:cytochrome c oxidase subunit 1
MVLAGICGAMMLLAFVIFMYNIIMSIGLKGLLGIYKKSQIDTNDCLTQQKD